MVEELLSRSGAIGKETAKGIADAAMLEVASITVGRMVPVQLYDWLVTSPSANSILGSVLTVIKVYSPSRGSRVTPSVEVTNSTFLQVC